ncbi:MAG: alpha-ketoglutarate-dependent dioxygenase AlkB [Acidobacteria bacterium]|nr:alpha-ketoglutarate-dependent dioxygenase AlkB [Acidobacteriota bacterium]
MKTDAGTRIEIFPGALHLPGFLSVAQQYVLGARCRSIGTGSPGWYVPTVRGGGKMSVRMVCLGYHWNPKTYTYETRRQDYDGQPVQALPGDLRDLGVRLAGAAGMQIAPDVCILNYYGVDGKMGLHQDKDERPETLRAGLPIVSVSIGDTAKFVLGGFNRKDSTTTVLLKSGDGFVFGGLSRLRYHGVAGLLPGTAPRGLALNGRFNLTFREGAAN